MTLLGGMFSQFWGKLKIGWFLFKTIFATNVELKRDKTGEGFVNNWSKYQNTVQEFLAKYNVDNEDRIDYNNTRKHHYSNFSHLDNPDDPEFKDKSGGDRLLERVGLVYEEDGKTPRNPAEAFDMTYEEYNEYKKKILPRAATKKVTYNDIKRFVERKRGVQKVSNKETADRTPRNTKKWSEEADGGRKKKRKSKRSQFTKAERKAYQEAIKKRKE
jgi:hypothetical protein